MELFHAESMIPDRVYRKFAGQKQEYLQER